MKDKIINLIENAGDAFGNKIQRNVAVGNVIRNFQVEEKKNQLIKDIEDNNTFIDVSEIIYSDKVGVIFKTRPRNSHDRWDKLYPYRIALMTEKGTWNVVSTVCDTVDSAMILLIANKNNRENMIEAVMELLNIKVEEF